MPPINWINQGGWLSNNYLNKTFQMAAQPLLRFRQFCKFKEEFGKSKGQSVNWLKVGDVATIGGRIAETSAMPVTDYNQVWGTLTVDEYGNSIPFTFKVDALSMFELETIIKATLLNDAVKCIDGEIEREFNKCLVRYVGTSAAAVGVVTTNGTATAVNNSPLNTLHIRRMLLELKRRNVPGWESANGDYACIASVEAMDGIRGALESVFQYTETGLKKVMNGEVGRYFGVRFVEDSFATRFVYNSTLRTVTTKVWSNGASLDAYMFGSPTVREAIVVPEEIRRKEKTDYGRSDGLAWYMLAGWKLEWDAADGQAHCRIVKWDSAS